MCYFEDQFEEVEHSRRAILTNQTPSSLQLGTKTDPITAEHADTCAG